MADETELNCRRRYSRLFAETLSDGSESSSAAIIEHESLDVSVPFLKFIFYCLIISSCLKNSRRRSISGLIIGIFPFISDWMS